MRNTLLTLKRPALVSFLIVIPFMLLEWANRQNPGQGFPIPLFAILWMLAIVFLAVITPIVQNIRTVHNTLTRPVSLLIRVILLLFIAATWIMILIDQMPCFLGVPNCD